MMGFSAIGAQPLGDLPYGFLTQLGFGVAHDAALFSATGVDTKVATANTSDIGFKAGASDE